ncbi:hypothetical protein [Thermus phage TSP4]|nr:hypothetical protein [Thermus phage TSP4]
MSSKEGRTASVDLSSLSASRTSSTLTLRLVSRVSVVAISLGSKPRRCSFRTRSLKLKVLLLHAVGELLAVLHAKLHAFSLQRYHEELVQIAAVVAVNAYVTQGLVLHGNSPKLALSSA